MKKGDDLYVSALIVSAGKGTRMNMNIKKQFIEIAGKPVLARTLQAFQDCPGVDEIVLVLDEQDIFDTKRDIVDYYELTKVKTLVAGGKERQNSVYNGLREVSKECDVVLIHDGARPFVSEDILQRSIRDAYENGLACVAVPSKDTIKAVSEDGYIKATLERKMLWAVQTPQSFRYGLILEAHRKAAEDGFLGTDDSVLAERLGHDVKIVMGSYDNIKITTREDLIMAEAIARELD